MDITLNSKQTYQNQFAEEKVLLLDNFIDINKVNIFLTDSFPHLQSSDFSITIAYIRYRPNENCYFLYELQYSDSINKSTEYYYIKVSDKIKYQREVANISDSFKDKLICLNEYNAYLCRFPVDYKLDILKIYDIDKPKLFDCLKKIFESYVDLTIADITPLKFEILRYKPEVRIVARCSYHIEDIHNNKTQCSIILRMEDKKRLEYAFNISNDISQKLNSHNCLYVPRIEYYERDSGIIFTEDINGRKFNYSIRQLTANEDIQKAAVALSELHALEVKPLEVKTAQDFLKKLNKIYNFIEPYECFDTSLITSIKEKMQNIANMISGNRLTMIHGDFHQGQVIFQDDKVCILDLDGVTLGDPILDLSNFVIQLYKLNLKNSISDYEVKSKLFIDTYQKKCGRAINIKAFNYYRVIGLNELIGKELRRQRKGWKKKIISLLNESKRVLES